MRTMYDAVTARNIPRDARMVAGYIDKIKLEPWTAADWALFPNAVKVTIVKKASTNAGHVLDVEPGDATPAEAPGWVRMRRAAGADPTIYCNLSTWPAVRQAFIDQGVAQPHYWVAKYDNNPAWGAGWAALGCVAKQYAGDVPPGIDLSSVADFWPGVDGDTKVTPEEIKAVAVAVWNEPLQNALDPGWSASRDILRNGHMEAGRGRRELNAKLDAMSTKLVDIALKVAAQQGVPTAELAAALLAGLLPEVKEELSDVEHLDEDAVAAKVDALIAARYAS
jgi:hypothetical protein